MTNKYEEIYDEKRKKYYLANLCGYIINYILISNNKYNRNILACKNNN